MSNNLVKSNSKLIKVGNKLMRISINDITPEPEPEPEQVAGLYDEQGNLVKTWDELVQEGLVTVG